MIQSVYSPLKLVPWTFQHSAAHHNVRLIEGAATGVELNNFLRTPRHEGVFLRPPSRERFVQRIGNDKFSKETRRADMYLYLGKHPPWTPEVRRPTGNIDCWSVLALPCPNSPLKRTLIG